MHGDDEDLAPYHEWGDEFDWGGLNDCCNWFPKQLQRWARFNLASCKEKYGTMRLEYVGCCHIGIYGLIFPGRLYFHLQNPMLRTINDKIADIAALCGISALFRGYQRLIFNIVTIRAVRKWPHLQKEITDELEFRDLLYGWVKKYIGYKCYWVSHEAK